MASSITIPEFTAKSIAEVEALSKEELNNYLTEKRAFEDATMSKKIQDAIEAAGSDNVQKAELEKALHNFEVKQDEHFAMLKSAFEGKFMKGNPKLKSLKETLIEKKADIQRIIDKKGESVNFTVKAVGNMTSANISGGDVPQSQRIAGFNTIASRAPRLLDLFTSANATSNKIDWVYQSGKEGAAGGTAEGILKNQIDFDLVVASQSVVKRTAFVKVTTEMLQDVDFIQSEINNELVRELLKDVEATAYSGDNTGSNLNGVRTVAAAFAAGTFALTVDNANNADVLAVAVNQIKIAEQGQPTHILMHPSDVTALKLYKVSTTDRRYVDRLMMIGSTLVFDGIPIVETTLVTVGEYLVGAFDLATMYTKEDMNIEIGMDSDDFTKNFRTILIEWRGALVVKNNDRTAFVKGVFATDAAALETI